MPDLFRTVSPLYFSPDNMGLLDPATSDGRVIFFLPWEKMTIAGTTDSPTDVTSHPIPTEEDINFILNEVRNYLSVDVEGELGPLRCALGRGRRVCGSSAGAGAAQPGQPALSGGRRGVSESRDSLVIDQHKDIR